MKNTILVLLALMVSGSASSQLGWKWVNPMPQGNALTDIWMFNDHEILLVGGAGTVMRSTDFGATWAVNHGIANSHSMFRSVFFRNSQEGWIAGDGRLVLHTTNGGNDWSLISSSGLETPGRLLFRSADTGWLVGGSASGGLALKTRDGGTTWDTMLSTSATLEDVCFLTDSVGWVLGSDAMVHRTSDAGSTWASTPTTLQPPLKSLYAMSSDTVWVAGYYNLAQTTDAGQTWQIRLHIDDTFRSITFADRNIGWAAGIGGNIARTTDGGATWTWSQIEGWPAFLRIAGQVSGYGLATGHRGLIFLTTDSGQTWSGRTAGAGEDLLSIDFPSAHEGWVGGIGGLIMHTTDEGATWVVSYDSSGETAWAIDFVSSSTGWVVGGRTIRKTTDGGQTWHHSSTPSSGYALSVSFVDSLTGWISGEGSDQIHRTTNGGVSWESQGRSDFQHISQVQFITPSIGWALDEFYSDGVDSSILRTTDGGATWTRHSVGTTQGHVRRFCFVSSSLGWASGALEQIWRTTDGGMSWTRQHVGGYRTAFNIGFSSETHGLAVGGGEYYDDLVLHTTDGGVNWTEQRTCNSQFLYNVFCLGEQKCWMVGVGGTILATTDGVSSLNNDLLSSHRPSQLMLDQNYPNPFNPSTTITYALPHSSDVRLTIFNAIGQQVATLVNGRQDAGTYSRIWTATGMPSGVYFYRLESRGTIETKKLLLLR